jgi:hypothetical protein
MSVFFGYPEYPADAAETMRRTALQLSSKYNCVTWQSLAVSGRLIMAQVLESIDESEFAVFDLTYPNPNVLFEAGYALARGKSFWITVDLTVKSALRSWSELAVLKPVGYTGYDNSAKLASYFRRTDPVSTVPPLFETLIEPNLPEYDIRTTLLYCPPFSAFEAANQLTNLVNRRIDAGLQVSTSDPRESSLDTLEWLAAQLGNAAGVMIHFAGPQRVRADIINLRNSFLAGLAAGLEIPLKMLAPGNFIQPFDYGPLLSVYETASSCVQLGGAWLDQLKISTVQPRARTGTRRSPLSGFRVGEHVAENERTQLSDYFIETAAFSNVISTRNSLFVGHRGTGKTANALQAHNFLSSKPNHLSVLIKPAGFEFPGLLAAVDRLPPFTHEYLFDSLWQFVVQTELAAACLERLERRPVHTPDTPAEAAFREYMVGAPFEARADASVRLDQALSALMAAQDAETITVESGRVLVNEAFHSDALKVLRHQLGAVLGPYDRVSVIIDNLDKGWEKTARLDVLARLILGLMSARGRLRVDFGKEDWWRREVHLTIAIFLRSDIFAYVQAHAREQDKLDESIIRWSDPELLLALLDARVEAGWPTPHIPETWGGLFPEEIDGRLAKDVVMSTILPRPRDLVYFANAAIGRAIDRGHSEVQVTDLLDGLATYSQYASQALLVENGITIPQLQDVLYGFLGLGPVVTRLQIEELLQSTTVDADRWAAVIQRLVEMSFLGLEVRAEHFVYPEIGASFQREWALASRHQPDLGLWRFRLHNAFHAYLEVPST